MVKRYIEFICLREIQVPQFLLTTLNNLELALNKPLTTSGQAIVPLLANTSLELPLPEILISEKLSSSINYTNYLYTNFKKTASAQNFQAFKLIATYLVSMANTQPSQNIGSSSITLLTILMTSF